MPLHLDEYQADAVQLRYSLQSSDRITGAAPHLRRNDPERADHPGGDVHDRHTDTVRIGSRTRYRLEPRHPLDDLVDARIVL